MIARALPLLLVATLGAAQGQERPRPDLEFLGGRALENDTVVPTHAEAEARLAAGDARFAAVRAAAPASAAPDDALRAWQEALVVSRRGDGVRALARDPNAKERTLTWLPGPDEARERIVAGVEIAVRERLLLAGEPTRRAWRERFEEPATRALELARANFDEARLLDVERVFPFTQSGTRAALALADVALERGETERAMAWIERARGAASDADASATFAEALELRTRAIGVRTVGDDGRAAWSRARRFVLRDAFALGEEELLRPAERTRVLLGAVADAAGGLFVQGAERLLHRAADGTWSTAEIGTLLGDTRVRAPFSDRASDWPTAPDAADGTALAVVGRADDELDNALLLVALPTLRRRFVRAGAAELVDATRVEFAPGARLLLGRAFAPARIWRGVAGAPRASTRLAPGAIEARLLELDSATGTLRHALVLARGASRVAARERENLGITWLAPSPAPLGRDGSTLLVATGLGTLSAVDALDLRLLWTVRTVRPRADERRTVSLAAPSVEGEFGTFASDDGPAIVHWRRAPLAAPAGLAELLRPASFGLERGAFLGCEGGRTIVATPDGRIAEEGLGTSLDLGPREALLRAAIVVERRVIAVTERALLLLDRDQDLRVLDRIELGPTGAGRPVLANGWVWVVGPGRVAGFAPE